MALVNKAELADLIRCSLPTLGKLIKKYPDLPVERRGRNGEQWQFDPDAVIAFLEAKRNEAAEQASARADLLDQFRLPIDDQAPAEDRSLSPTQQLAAVKTRMLLAKEAREAGMLVPVSDVRMALTSAVSGLAQAHDGFTNRIGRRHNLPRAVMDEIAKDLSETRTAFVRALGPFTPADARA
jgi:phage terminase Nu1 subunit (DNA packaging protein)